MRFPRPFFLTVMLATSLAGAGAVWLQQSTTTRSDAPAAERRAGERAVHVNPGRQPQVETGLTTYHGEPATVACMTCHGTREPNLDLGLESTTPTEFHANLQYAHGGLSCLSCHDANNYDTLKRADGRTVEFAQASTQLCSQCHGPQTRDYERGSHGGMQGYWDLSRGERTRNSCTDCHDAHAPAFPALIPVFPPQDSGARQQAVRAILHGHD